MKREQVRIEVFDGEKYDGEWPPKSPAGFMAWFQQHIDRIPPEYRDKAEIELDSILSYEDSHYARIKIMYWRPETDEEQQARMDRLRAEEQVRVIDERRTLAALKKKYGE